jgi:hypothetical protein
MKTFSTVFITIWLGLNYGYCQTRKLINLPILKESPQIDSLIDLMIRQPQELVVSDSLERSKDDWIILSVNEEENDTFYFTLGTENKKYINLPINYIVHELYNADGVRIKPHFGCFTYKRYRVFVWTIDRFYGFLSKSNKNKRYDYIYRIKGTGSSDESPVMSYKSGTYIYKKNIGFKPLEIIPLR